MPPPRRQRWVMCAVVAGIAGAVLLAVFVTVALAGQTPTLASTSGSVQLGQIVVIPPRDKCAKAGNSHSWDSPNCITQKCCQLSGFKCYEVHSGYAKCMKKCTPGVDGTCLVHAVTSLAQTSNITYSATNLFCFIWYQHVTGSTKPNHELELIRTSLFLGANIFGCESYRVFSDISTWLSPGGVGTVKIEDVENNFHFAKRKFNGHWINSNMFIQTWRKIKEEKMWSSKDWTVKTDADAVFLPARLREKLGSFEVTSNGIYIENCKYANYGFFGALEVFSHKAAATYMANLDDCKASLNYMSPDKLIPEPWGEDVFAQRCMDLHGVDKVSGFELITDGLCPTDIVGSKKDKKWKFNCATRKTAVLHPFAKAKEYFDCLSDTQR